MDSKILCVSLLLGVVCLWSTEASPLEGAALDHSTQDMVDISMRKGYPGDENTKAGVESKSAALAAQMAKQYANKAKTYEAKAKLTSQMAKDRHYYYLEYTKLAEEAKRKSREYEQLANREGYRIGGHRERQKEWESKTREAETMCKEMDVKCQQLYTTAQERYRSSSVAYSAASISYAEAYGYQRRADKMAEYVAELKQKAENFQKEAANHYNQGRENDNKAASEKAKAHQQADDTQKHNAASRAYQQEAIKTRMASRSNMVKYIHNRVMAERHYNYAIEEELKSEMEKKKADEYARMSEHSGAIYKILSREYAYNAARAKHEQTRSQVMSESSREAQALVGETGPLIKLSQADNDNPDEEGYNRLNVFDADDPVKGAASEEKDPSQLSGEGL